MEQIVQFDTLGSTFIPMIFVDKDWVDLFGNFEDPIDELVKEFYSNARFTGVELCVDTLFCNLHLTSHGG